MRGRKKKGEIFSKDHGTIIEKYEAGKGIKNLANEYKVSIREITSFLKLNQVPIRAKGRPNKSIKPVETLNLSEPLGN
jgi:hypothetical protein